jgi:hypothetical protein
MSYWPSDNEYHYFPRYPRSIASDPARDQYDHRRLEHPAGDHPSSTILCPLRMGWDGVPQKCGLTIAEGMRDQVRESDLRLAGGTFVVIFSLVGSVVKPKRFAGVFSAAPSVAIAGLLIAAHSISVDETRQDARSLILGAFAMIIAAVIGLPILKRLSALGTASWIAIIWLVVAAVGYFAVLR